MDAGGTSLLHWDAVIQLLLPVALVLAVLLASLGSWTGCFIFYVYKVGRLGRPLCAKLCPWLRGNQSLRFFPGPEFGDTGLGLPVDPASMAIDGL